MLTGKPPFEGDTFLDLLHKHRYAQFDRVRRIATDVPHDLDDLISRMLDKDPAQRPPDCLVLHKQLEAIRKKADRKDQATQIPLGDTVAETKPTFDPDTRQAALCRSRRRTPRLRKGRSRGSSIGRWC